MQDQMNEVSNEEIPQWLDSATDHIGDMCEAGTCKNDVIAYIDSLNLEKEKRDTLMSGTFIAIGRSLAQQNDPIVNLNRIEGLMSKLEALRSGSRKGEMVDEAVEE